VAVKARKTVRSGRSRKEKQRKNEQHRKKSEQEGKFNRMSSAGKYRIRRVAGTRKPEGFQPLGIRWKSQRIRPCHTLLFPRQY
jgi:hypothetical protein